MAILDSDLFIVSRNFKNYKAKARQLLEYSPPLDDPIAMVFFQETAPMYWTQLTDGNLNNATLRVVNTSGGTAVDGQSFNNVFKSHDTKIKNHTHGTGGGNHSHTASGGSHKHGVNAGSHTHSLSGGGASHNHTSSGKGGAGNNLPARNQNQYRNNPSWRDTNLGSVNLKTSVNAAKAGVSVKASTNDSVSFSSGASGTLTVSGLTAKSPETSGSSINFEIKYSKSIICRKDPL